jgi:hypothetical protein
MVNDLDAIKVKFECCGKYRTESLGWLKTQPTDTFVCPFCGTGVKYDHLEYVRMINEKGDG